MTLLTPIVRAFRSELLKCRRWSMFAGTGIMLVASAFFASLTFHQITSGVTGREVDPLVHAFSTELGLITVVGQACSFIIVVALIIVTVNLAAEWSQGTWRNLLVREPRRLRLLVGKMLALMLFVLGSMTLTLVGSSVLILTVAHAQGVQTTAWTSVAGLSASLGFLGNDGLCLRGTCLWVDAPGVQARGKASGSARERAAHGARQPRAPDADCRRVGHIGVPPHLAPRSYHCWRASGWSAPGENGLDRLALPALLHQS